MDMAETKAKAFEMYRAGSSVAQVRSKLKVSNSTAYQWSKTFREESRQPSRPAAAELDTLAAPQAINAELLKRLAQLAGTHGIDQVQATLGHLRAVLALMSSDAPSAELEDDEAAMSQAMNGEASQEATASA